MLNSGRQRRRDLAPPAISEDRNHFAGRVGGFLILFLLIIIIILELETGIVKTLLLLLVWMLHKKHKGKIVP